jgi:hypothetical protein
MKMRIDGEKHLYIDAKDTEAGGLVVRDQSN